MKPWHFFDTFGTRIFDLHFFYQFIRWKDSCIVYYYWSFAHSRLVFALFFLSILSVLLDFKIFFPCDFASPIFPQIFFCCRFQLLRRLWRQSPLSSSSFESLSGLRSCATHSSVVFSCFKRSEILAASFNSAESTNPCNKKHQSRFLLKRNARRKYHISIKFQTKQVEIWENNVRYWWICIERIFFNSAAQWSCVRLKISTERMNLWYNTKCKIIEWLYRDLYKSSLWSLVLSQPNRITS